VIDFKTELSTLFIRAFAAGAMRYPLLAMTKSIILFLRKPRHSILMFIEYALTIAAYMHDRLFTVHHTPPFTDSNDTIDPVDNTVPNNQRGEDDGDNIHHIPPP